MTKPVTDTLASRVSIRKFLTNPIPDEILTTILETARRSSTSSNMQSYSMIVVKNPETKKQLAELAGGQKHIEVCPVFVAYCADIYRLEQVCKAEGVNLQKGLETTLVATVDAAIVGQSAQTLAESLGLGVVMIGAMRNHPAEVAKLLGLPKGVYVVYGMCLGYADPEQVPPQKPRLPSHAVIHTETYNAANVEAAIPPYNEALAKHYNALGTNQAEAAWSAPIAKRLQNKVRPELRAVLEELGFSFD